MILYNVTCLIDVSIESEWIEWMKMEHLPEVMATGKFKSFKIYRIDPHVDGDSGPTFSIQYLANSRKEFNEYVEAHGPGLKAKTLAKFGDLVNAFRTVMEEI